MIYHILTIILSLVLLSGCADSVSVDVSVDIVGFWYGLWHGIIFPVAWIISLVDDSVAIYAVYNNGGWYDFGFFLGVGGFSASAVKIS